MLKAVFKLLISTTILFGIHYLLNAQYCWSLAFADITLDYLVIFVLHASSYLITHLSVKRYPQKGAMAYLGLSLLKIIVASLYLFLTDGRYQNEEWRVLNFMLPYLALLMVELFISIRLIQSANN